MPRFLNLGVLAHVDAGKTSLTERLLYHTGAISALGSVDQGTTRTDTMQLEQQRGITIRAAVAPFEWNDLTVNLIDTPGHPDFIAEVERSLSVLDAVVLVVSAVEGVQPQTRRLARAISAIGLPCVVFCNKIDRVGAREQSLLGEIRTRLGWSIVPITSTSSLGTPQAEVQPLDLASNDAAVALIAEHDDALLDAWIAGQMNGSQFRTAFVSAVRAGHVVPVMFGSAMTGVGIGKLLDMLDAIAPDASPDDAALSAQAFKIERGPTGERIVMLRVWAGTLTSRAEVSLYVPGQDPLPVGKVARLELQTPTGFQVVQRATAGQIVHAHGLADMKVGDVLGVAPPTTTPRFFQPVFETEVVERNPKQRHHLRMALEEMADQDPFISLRFDPRAGVTSIRLFGDVQREVIESTLQEDYGLAVKFSEPRVICIERPIGVGESIEHISDGHPFVAGVGLKITAGEPNSGVRYHRNKFALGKTRPAFYMAIEETVLSTLNEGLLGWEVTDVDVELMHVEFVDAASTAGDFRALTPLVVMEALRQAETEICEPLQKFRLDVPEESLADVVRHLVQNRAMIQESTVSGRTATILGEIPAAEVPGFERSLPGISRGEGDFDHWQFGWLPIHGEPPARARTDFNPLDRVEYLSRQSGRL